MPDVCKLSQDDDEKLISTNPVCYNNSLANVVVMVTLDLGLDNW